MAILAARRAAAAILDQRSHPVVSTKPDGSPVTSADLAGDAILTEEGVDDGARLSSRRCWIGDPLDGTSHFVAGSDDFDTFVALAVDGVPVVAVTLQPATGLLLGAVAGGGAWIQDGGGPRRRLDLCPSRPARLATKAWLGAPGNLTALEAAASGLARLLQPTWSLCPRCFLPPSTSIDAMIGLSAGPPIDAWEWDIAPTDLIGSRGGRGCHRPLRRAAPLQSGGATLRLRRGHRRRAQPSPRPRRGAPALTAGALAPLGRSRLGITRDRQQRWLSRTQSRQCILQSVHFTWRPRMPTATAKDLRQRTSALLDSVRRGQEVVITYRGKRIAVLAPLDRIAQKELTPTAFGMWRRRRNMRDVSQWLDGRRAPRFPR